MNKYKNLEKKLANIKKTVINIIYKSKSSHIGSNFSCAHLVLTIFSRLIHKKNNWFIMSKGHASAVYYSTLHEFRYLKQKEIESFAQNGSLLSGHVSKSVNNIIAYSSGSLGNGVGVGCGICYGNKLKKSKAKCFVLISDGELNEGSTWESIMFAGHHKLENLVVVLDSNKLQNIDMVKNVINLDSLKRKIREFKWQTLSINGHSFKEIIKSLNTAKKNKKPLFIIANTVKGHGVSFMKNKILWHYKNPSEEEANKAKREILNA